MESPWTPSKQDLLELAGNIPNYRIDQIWKGLYDHGQSIADIQTVPKELREKLSTSLSPALEQRVLQSSSDNETLKWLWKLNDDAHIETVLMRYPNRSTVCVSSQAGCAMACGFCATGQAGYSRHLSVGEILEQVAAAKRAGIEDGKRLSNVVFMGMGEPMANLEAVITSVKRIINDFGIGARNIVVSTVGLIPQIDRLAQEELQIGLAVSLHAGNNELRNELVPINKAHPIEKLAQACIRYRETTGRRVSIEWAMMKDVNDSGKDASELAEFANQTDAHVNLIPLNPTPGWPTVGSDADTISRFTSELANHGVNVTVRKNRGNDIDAACGQLEANTLTIGKKSDRTK